MPLGKTSSSKWVRLDTFRDVSRFAPKRDRVHRDLQDASQLHAYSRSDRPQRDFGSDDTLLGQALEIDMNEVVCQGVFLRFLNQGHALFAVNIQFHQEILGHGGLYGLFKLLGIELDGFRFAIAIYDTGQRAGVAEFFATDGLGQHTRIGRQ